MSTHAIFHRGADVRGGKCPAPFFSFCSQRIYWLSGMELTKCSSERQTGKTLIRLLVQKQSDLGLPCLSRFDRNYCYRF